MLSMWWDHLQLINQRMSSSAFSFGLSSGKYNSSSASNKQLPVFVSRFASTKSFHSMGIVGCFCCAALYELN